MLPLLLTLFVAATQPVHAEWAFFDKGWKFHRGDSLPATPLSSGSCAAHFCKSSFDDTAWSATETPHDWAIEDLPGRDADTEFPVLQVREGAAACLTCYRVAAAAVHAIVDLLLLLLLCCSC